MISCYQAMRVLYTGRYHITSVFAFTCGRAKTIRIRYVWTQFFSKTEKKTSVLKNIRIRVDRAFRLFSTYLTRQTCIRTRVESVYSTPKIFGAEFENSWRSGVRSFTFTSVGGSRKSTCCQFNLFLESYL